MWSKTNGVVGGWGLPLWLIALGIALLLLLSHLRVRQPQPVAYRVPGDFPTIAEAIAQVPPGSVIVLQARVYKENLTIAKSLTLLGAEGAGEAVIEAAREATPVIKIEGRAMVWLQGIKITGSSGGCVGGARTGPGSVMTCPYALLVRGKAQVFLTDSQVSDNALGIKVAERGRLRITASQISRNGGNGLEIRGNARAVIERSRLAANGGSGLWTISSTHVALKDTEISGNGGPGLGAADGANATVKDSQIMGNREDGVWARGSAHVILDSTRITSNGLDGIRLLEGARATVRDSLIEGNGTAEGCSTKQFCNGIEVRSKAHLEVTGSVIQDNTAWGIAATLKKCGYDRNDFQGNVILQDNKITDNGRGEVCLPDMCILGDNCG